MVLKIKINLPNLDISEEVTDLLSKEKRKVRFQFMLKRVIVKGKVKRNTKVRDIYLNNSTKQFYRISHKVEQSIVSSINKEISEKRTLDF